MRRWTALCALLFPLHAAAAERIDLGDNLSSASISAPGFRVSLRMERRDLPDMPDTLVPVLRIGEAGEVRLELVGEAAGFDFPQGSAELVETDPDNGVPEVAFSSFTGGAHCCTAVKVARLGDDGRWGVADLGLWDGDGGSFSDLDGDGVAEFSSRDNRFLYTFDCYACSETPLIIFSVVGGRPKDVSAEPRFVDAHRGWLRDMEAQLAENGGEKSPGWWAGWVAAKARVGEGKEAWETFMAEYRPAPDEPGVTVCAVEAEECPEDQWITMPLPDALEKFLRTNGFRID